MKWARGGAVGEGEVLLQCVGLWCAAQGTSEGRSDCAKSEKLGLVHDWYRYAGSMYTNAWYMYDKV